MKKNKWFGWAFVAAMVGTGFTACTNETEEVLAQESEIKLTSEITPSRVTSLDYQSTQIVEGQQVGITITGAKSEHNNVAWEAGANGTLNNTGDEIYYGNGTATITAYHPYNSSWTGTSHSFSVSTDQSTEVGYLASDLLWTTKTATKSEEAVTLNFAHKLAKINVTLVPENTDTDLSGAIIYICGSNTTTYFDPTTGELSDYPYTNITEIKAGTTTSTAYTASAIVIPQEVSGKFIKITHEDKTYYYTLSSAKTLASGKSYSYTLTVKDKQLINTGSSISPWNPDSEEGKEGDAEEEDSNVIPNNEIWYTTTDNQAITNPQVSFGANIISNQYIDGKGVIRFNGNVTEIGKDAFDSYTSLTSITIPNSVTTIGNTAFYGCTSLTSITIPNSVTTIGINPFIKCDLLEEMIVEGNNTIYDSRNGCNAIIQTETHTLIAGCKNTIIPNNVNKIDAGAFLNCSNLTSITIPNSVTEIGTEAFMGCTSLSTVYVMATNSPTLGSDVFEFCGGNFTIYVPTGTVTTYQNAANWSKYASKIVENK